MQNQTYISIPANHSHEGINLPQTAAGITGGVAASYCLLKGSKVVLKPFYVKFLKELDKFTPAEKADLAKEANRMVDESGIVKKGFKGITLADLGESETRTPSAITEFLNLNNTEQILKERQYLRDATIEIANEMKQVKENGPLYPKTLFWLSKITKPLVKISDGLYGKFESVGIIQVLRTGGFFPIINRIYSEKPVTLLHEVGHAINTNKSTLTRIPFFLMIVSAGILTPFVMINAMLTKKPKENEENQKDSISFFKKTRDFTHKHIGLTMGGLFVPMLVEEALATSRAIKFVNASNVLSTSVKKQHNKALMYAYSTYLVGTTLYSLTAKLSVSVKDRIVQLLSRKKD